MDYNSAGVPQEETSLERLSTYDNKTELSIWKNELYLATLQHPNKIKCDENEAEFYTDEAFLRLSAERSYQLLSENPQFADITLIAVEDGMRIPANRIVLVSACQYFLTMFTISLCEANSNEVQFYDISGQTLEQIVKFCYTGSVDIYEDTVFNLLHSANLFGLNSIERSCELFLIQQLHPANCLGFASYAEYYDKATLLEVAIAFICHHFLEIIKHTEFTRLTLRQVKNLLSSEYLNVEKEENVFYATNAWLQIGPKEHLQHAVEVLALVKMPLVERIFLSNIVELIYGAETIQKVINLQTSALEIYSLTPRLYVKSNFDEILIVCGSFCPVLAGPVDRSFNIEYYSKTSDEWILRKINPKQIVKDFSMVFFNGALLVLSAFEDSAVSFKQLNLLEMSWSEYNITPISNSPQQLVALGGYLYSILNDFSGTINRYDPITKIWNKLSSMHTGRKDAGIIVANYRICVIGGYGEDSEVLETVEYYDPITDIWSMGVSMQQGRCGHGVEIVDGAIYAVGGMTNLGVHISTTSVEKLDQQTGKWSSVAPLREPRAYFGIYGKTEPNDRTLVISGGFYYDSVRVEHFNTEIYSCDHNRWSYGSYNKKARTGAHLFAVPNLPEYGFY